VDWSIRKAQGKNKEDSGIKTERRRREVVTVRKLGREAEMAKRRLASSCSTQISAENFELIATTASQVILAPQSEGQLLEAIKTLIEALSHSEEMSIDKILKTGVVERLCQLLSNPNDELQIEILRCFVNISADVPIIARSVRSALPILVTLLCTQHPRLTELACWVLGNLASEDDSLRYGKPVLLNESIYSHLKIT